ncbi:hypothetical protein B0H13DRAFT_1877310 [Mycena leptocephala]|nr:hypothetical protein B0H13DRAFT_1877310 [Mycena leptocephala]
MRGGAVICMYLSRSQFVDSLCSSKVQRRWCCSRDSAASEATNQGARQPPSPLVPRPSIPHPLQRKGKHPILFGPQNSTLVQTLLPPLIADEEEDEYYDDDDPLPSDFPDVPESFLDDVADDEDQDNSDRIGTSPRKPPGLLVPLRSVIAWRALRKRRCGPTRSWRDMDALSERGAHQCSCLTDGALLKVAVLTFTSDFHTKEITEMYDLEITPCKCWSAPRQLLEQGLFPSAPQRPGLAVDVRLLEFTRKLFVRIAPNKSAMVGALEEHLGDLGFKLLHDDSMRRQFLACLEWYTHLRDRVDAHVDRVLEVTQKYQLSANAVEDDDAEHDPRSIPSAQEEENPFPDPEARARPSEYLCAHCPACFGGDFKRGDGDTGDIPDIKVCVDACFTQKKRKSVPDPPKSHPHTHFVPEEQSELMEKFVDAVRGTVKPKRPKRRKAHIGEEEDEDERDVIQPGDDEDGYEHPDLPLPWSVLDSCEASFKAADEKRAKASTKLHDDTVLMALLCRHDRVLWIVNMHSAGEKQFPVLLLIETLYQHLPLWFIVGLLYDIACQLERSARKWGFLDRYLDRLIFAVAVFHVGFGFTNGEDVSGSGTHQSSHRPFAGVQLSSSFITLDTQVKHSDEGNLFRLGEWNKRRALHSAEKRAAAGVWSLTYRPARAVGEAGEGADQAAGTSIEEYGWKAIEVPSERTVGCLPVAALEAIEAEDSIRIQETKEDRRKAQAELTKMEKRLEKKVRALGVEDRKQLNNVKTTKYLELRMRCRSLKRRLRDRLRARKFELDRVERSARRQLASADQGQGSTRGVIAPERIDEKKVWELDVDDSVWQDVGLDDDDDEPPLWLSNDGVRKGIPAMLDLERSKEEDLELAKEAGPCSSGFQRSGRSHGGSALQSVPRRERLLRLCATWRRSIGNDETLPEWGPTTEELLAVRLEQQTAARGEDGYASEDEEDEYESEADPTWRTSKSWTRLTLRTFTEGFVVNTISDKVKLKSRHGLGRDERCVVGLGSTK